MGNPTQTNLSLTAVTEAFEALYRASLPPFSKRLTTSEMLAELAEGSHLCGVFASENEYWEIVPAFILGGFERKQRVFYIADTHELNAIRQVLTDQGVDVVSSEASGALILERAENVYLADGRFEPKRMFDTIRHAAAEARAHGFTGLRITGEMSWALCGAPGADTLGFYEAHVDAVLRETGTTALCQYDLRSFPPAMLTAVIITHPVVMVQGELIENPCYSAPENVREQTPDAIVLQCLLGGMVARAQAQRQLEREQSRFRALFESSPLGIVVFEAPSLRYTAVNPAFCDLLGYSEAELLHLSAFDITPPEEMKEEILEAQRYLRGEVPVFRREKYYLRKDGAKVAASVVASLISEGTEEPYGIALIEDISARRDAEMVLRRSAEELTRLVDARTLELRQTAQELGEEVTRRKQIEAALSAANTELERIFSSAQVLMEYLDKDFTILRVNRAYAAADGHPVGFFVGKKHFDLYPNERVREIFQRAVETGEPYSAVEDCFSHSEHPGSRATYWDWDLLPLKDAAGNVEALLLCRVNRTSHVRSQARKQLALETLEILQSPRSQREIIEKLLERVLNFTGCEMGGIRLKANADFPYYAVRGYSEEFVGSECSLLARDECGRIRSDSVGRPLLECVCGDLVRGITTPGYAPYMTARGSFWTNSVSQIMISLQDTPQPNRRGRCVSEGFESAALIPLHAGEDIIGLLQLNDRRPDCFSEDLVEFLEDLGSSIGVAMARGQSESQLRERLKELKCLYGVIDIIGENAPADVTLQNVVNLIPSAFVDPEKTHARLILDGYSYVTSGFAEGTHRICAEVGSARANSGMLEVYLAEGEDLDFEIEELSLIHAIAERIDRYTERQRLQAELIRTERLAATGKLAASVAHEINSPLQAIGVLLNSMRRSRAMESGLFGQLGVIEQAFGSIRETVRRLLDLSRPAPPARVQIDLNEIARQTGALVSAFLRKDRIALTLELDESLPRVLGAPDQLSHLLMNLVNNAQEAIVTSRESVGNRLDRILLRSRRDAEGVTLAVEDSGPGIAEEDAERIFDPFYTRKKKQGIGIGLFSCREIIVEHGGSIRAERSLLGGAAMVVTLPASEPEDVHEAL